MMSRRALWFRRALAITLTVVMLQQIWHYCHRYVLADKFAVVVPGKIYRGAWQRPWPMRRLVHEYKIKTIVALAHPADHALAVSERALADKLGCRWVHIPIVDVRGLGDKDAVSDQLEKAAAIIADPANQPVYFHCHHGVNRASMVQIAYRTKYCGWTLKQATDEIARSFGLVEVSHGPDYRHMELFYAERVVPARRESETPRTAGEVKTLY